MKRFAITMFAAALLSVAGSASVARAAGSSKAAMNRTLPELKFTGVTFGDAVDFLRDVTGANINVNWKALAAANVAPDAQVNIRLTSVPLRKALQILLTEAGGGESLTYYLEDNVIEITTKEIADKIMYTRVYPVEDLLLEVQDFTDAPSFDLTNSNSGGGSGGGGGAGGGGGGQSRGGIFAQNPSSTNAEAPKTKTQRGEALVQLVISTIQPDIWRDNGGTAVIRYFNGTLVVTAPLSVHEALGG